MFIKGETYHEFQMWSSGYSSSRLTNPEDGVQMSKMCEFDIQICLAFTPGSINSGGFAKNWTASFHFVRVE